MASDPGSGGPVDPSHIITNKVPVRPSRAAPEPAAPPLALPGGSVAGGIPAPLGPRPSTAAAAYANAAAKLAADCRPPAG